MERKAIFIRRWSPRLSNACYLVFLCCFILVSPASHHIRQGKNQDAETGLLDIYLINLRRRPERLDNVANQLRKQRIAFRRFPGIDGRRIKAELDKGGYPNFNLDKDSKVDWGLVIEQIEAHKNLDYGQVGAWQSHLQVMFYALRKYERTNVDGPVLILEDDVVIDEDFATKMKAAFKELPDDWEIFGAGHFGSFCLKKDHPLYCRAHEYWGMHGYVLRNASVIKRIISIFNSNRFQIADFAWQDMFRDQLKAYVSLPRTLIFQNYQNFGSDISNSGHDFDQFAIHYSPNYSPFWAKQRMNLY